jgi:predicted transposase/invertase (TIGR01784 family)
MNLGNYIRFDWAMKRLLRNKADFVVLEGFLSELLRFDVKIEEVLESEGNQEHGQDKFNRVDILVKNIHNEYFIIEIQNEMEFDYFQRIIYGTSKVITENIKLGEKYSKIKKVFSISIVYFDLGQGEDYVYHGTTDFLGIHNKDKLILSEKQRKILNKREPKDLFPEYYIIKVNQFNDIAKDTLDQWIYFLKNTEIKDEFSAKGLHKAKELLQIDKMSRDEQRKYTRHLEDLSYAASMNWSRKKEIEFQMMERERIGHKHGLQTGLEKGMEAGLEQGREEGLEQGREEERKIQEEKTKQMVLSLLASQVDLNTIINATGLSQAEIQKIKEGVDE